MITNVNAMILQVKTDKVSFKELLNVILRHTFKKFYLLAPLPLNHFLTGAFQRHEWQPDLIHTEREIHEYMEKKIEKYHFFMRK